MPTFQTIYLLKADDTHYPQTPRDDNDKDTYTQKVQRQRRKKFQCSSVNVYRLQYPLPHAHCPLEDKDKMTERPNLLYIFENVTTQGYQNGMVGESLVMHGG